MRKPTIVASAVLLISLVVMLSRSGSMGVEGNQKAVVEGPMSTEGLAVFQLRDGCTAGPPDPWVPGRTAEDCEPGVTAIRQNGEWAAAIYFARAGDIGNPDRVYTYSDGRRIYLPSGVATLHDDNMVDLESQVDAFLLGLGKGKESR